MIQIISPTRIEVDGKDAGLPVDYILANPGSKREINAAFIVWHESHVIACQTKDAECAAFKAECLNGVAQAVAAKEAIRRECDAELQSIRADMEALGTKEEAQEIRRQLEITAVQRSIDAQMAKLLELRGIAEPQPTDAKP